MITLRRREPKVVSAPPMAIELPGMNLLVKLTMADDPDGDRTDLPSRVEDVVPASGGSPTRFLIAEPRFPGDVVGPEPDGRWLLSWVSERGRWELEVSCMGDVRAAAGSPTGVGVRSWWLEQAGAPRRDQRRRFYRIGCTLPIGVDVLADPFPTLTGRAVDLSEGGLCCVLPSTDLEVGTRAIARLPLDGATPDGAPTAFETVVQRVRRPAPRARVAGWHREVALAFDDPDAHGEALRRTIARMQLRARRLAAPEPADRH